jgi:hypothetical protein
MIKFNTSFEIDKENLKISVPIYSKGLNEILKKAFDKDFDKITVSISNVKQIDQ